MNTTSASKPNTITAISILTSFVNPIIVIRFYQIGYPITFLLGFIGNIASLITFSRSTLRKVSTGRLFIILAISDTFYLFMCIFDFVEFGLQVRFYQRIPYDEICRFRSFVMYVSQTLSSWILVTISVDRWIRTRFPFKSGSLCTPKKVLLVVGVLLIIDVGLHSHMLSPLYGMLIPGFANAACGPILPGGSYLGFYLYQWSVIQIFIICLIPVILMLLILLDIVIYVRIRKRAVIQPAQFQSGENRTYQNRHVQLQMFILMLTSAVIFLITTFPLAIYRITSPREIDFKRSVLTITSVWTGLAWFQSLNYAVNFYSHCLTSTLFRKEFKKQVKVLCCAGATRVEVVKLIKLEHRLRPAQR